MKRLYFTLLAIGISVATYAQNDTTITTRTKKYTKGDSSVTTIETDTVVNAHKSFKFKFDHKKEMYKPSSHPGWSVHPTVARIDIGLATLVDNGSFTLSPENNFLRYRSWKSVNFGFDFFEAGYRFSSAFKIYASLGVDWTRFRLRENVTPLRYQTPLSYSVDNIDYDKNVFSNTYLRLPISFSWQTKENKDGHAFHIVAGPIFGLLIDGHVKQNSQENGYQHFRAGYNFAKVRYGGFVRVGDGCIGLFAKYYANDMFQDSPAQEGLKNLSLGLNFAF